MFFETFWTWLNAQLAGYIGDNTARVAAALEPAIIVLATLYVMLWGYLQLTGRIEEPFLYGLRRIVLLTVVLAAALHLWLYDAVIVDTFYRAPAELAAAVIGAADPIGSIDAIWQQGGAVAAQLWNRGGVFGGDFGFYLAGAVVWLFVGALCVYSMFLIALSSIASSVLLALGPLFLGMLLFESTRRFFEAWLAQLANYALVTVLTVMLGALLLQVVRSYAAQTAALGTAVLTVDALDMVLVCALAFLLMRQVMPIASGLAGGLALCTFNAVSRAAGWGVRAAALTGGGAVTAARVVGRFAGSSDLQPQRAHPPWREP